MKSIALFCTFMIPSIIYAQQVVDSTPSKTVELQRYIELAQSKKLSEHISWQRLLYTDHKGQSEVAFSGYFLAENGRQNAQVELEADVAALFKPPNLIKPFVVVSLRVVSG